MEASATPPAEPSQEPESSQDVTPATEPAPGDPPPGEATDQQPSEQGPVEPTPPPAEASEPSQHLPGNVPPPPYQDFGSPAGVLPQHTRAIAGEGEASVGVNSADAPALTGAVPPGHEADDTHQSASQP